MASVPLHQFTPFCPRCKAQTVVPARYPEPADTLACVCCGHEWDEADPAMVERAYRAEEAWQKYKPEALQKRTRTKARPVRT